jgi:DNA-binding Lrp family transcriptional regulator
MTPKPDKDLILLTHLRRNAREPMASISKKTNIPISTIFDRLKEYERSVILKHTCLLNFKRLGFDLKTHLLFKVRKEEREGFGRFLATHSNVNSAFRINNGYDYLVEGVFRNLEDLNGFYEAADRHGAEERSEYFILEDITREAFMSRQPELSTMPMIAAGKITDMMKGSGKVTDFRRETL